MKNSIKASAILMAVFCTYACNKNENEAINPEEPQKPVEVVKVPMTFSVEASKTVLNSDGSIGFNHIDEISIFDGVEGKEGNNKFTNTTAGDNQLSVTFSGKAAESSTSYYALYPYQENAEFSGTTITNVSLPASQTATLNSFDPAANISVAKTENSLLELKNVCALFQIVVAKGEHYNKAVISNNDGTEIYGEKISITIGNDGNPTYQILENSGSSSITLTGSMGSNNEETKYYVVILPKEYRRGIYVRLYDTEKSSTAIASRSTSSSIIIPRAAVKGFGHIKPDLLPGVFSVSATKKVQFSKGNLWCDASEGTGIGGNWVWAFEENQWDAPTSAADNGKVYSNYKSHVFHFFPTICGSSTDDTKGFGAGDHNPQISGSLTEYQKGDWGQVIDNTGYWTGLTQAECRYLLDINVPYGSAKRDITHININNLSTTFIKVRIKVKKVNDDVYYYGVLLFPDSFTWDTETMGKYPDITAWGEYGPTYHGDGKWDTNTYTKEECTAIENAGAVFLPAAGSRNGASPSTIANCSNYGYYEFHVPERKHFNFSTWENSPEGSDYGGHSVRLIHVVSE